MDASTTFRSQLKIHVNCERVYQALTTTQALETWLAESADVDMENDQFLFWGKYTPANPSRQSKHISLLDHKANRLLKFSWQIHDNPTTVTIKLRERDADTSIMTLIHEGGGTLHHQEHQYTLEDFWFLHMENLRRYLDGKPSEARVDFSQPMNGNIKHILESDATPEQIYAVLTQPELIEKWIASNAQIDLQKGGEYDLGWGIEGIKIVDLDEHKRLSLTWHEEDPNDVTIASWTLDASGGKTRITFTHSGFDDDHRNDGIWTGWMNFLNWIRSVAEYGPDWQPPLISLKDHQWAQIYPKAMHDAQDDMVLLEL